MGRSNSNLTHARLLELLDYSPETGEFRRKKRSSERSSHAVTPGQIAGGIGTYGYYCVRVDGVQYTAHRLAWFFVHGCWPEGVIDHLNGNKLDNRIANLRDTNDRLNANNRVGKAGFTARRGAKFEAFLTVDGKRKHLGTFSSQGEARQAYLIAKLNLGLCPSLSAKVQS